MPASGLAEAFGLGDKETVALVGGGGKTTAMFLLATELIGKGLRVLVTTTTKILPPKPSKWTGPIVVSSDRTHLLRLAIEGSFNTGGVLAAAGLNEEGKLVGVLPEWVDRARSSFDCVVVEADGAAHKPLKAPAEHEPVIPQSSTVVVPVVGIDSIGLPLSGDNVHRADIYERVTGLKLGDPVTTESVADLLASSEGLAKGIPERSRYIPLINKADDFRTRIRAGRLAFLAIGRGIEKAVVSSLKADPPFVEVYRDPVPFVSAIVLAAGKGERMKTSQPKQLMEIGGKPLLALTLEGIVKSSVGEVIVVIGHAAPDVIRCLERHVKGGVKFVVNDRFEEGQSTSMREGLLAASPNADAFLLALGDQPFAGPDLVDSLVQKYAVSGGKIVAPFFGGKRGNPVLFDRGLMDELLEVEGDKGAREVVERHHGEIQKVDLPSGEYLFDVDTRSDVEKVRRKLMEGR